MNSAWIKLRAHHGMCLAFFRGKGYSSGFVAHMAQVQQALEKNPLVRVVCETDLICKACPNNHDRVCCDQEKVSFYDAQVLKACGLTAGEILPYRTFQALVYDNILIPGKREHICGSCQWTELCHLTQQKPQHEERSFHDDKREDTRAV